MRRRPCDWDPPCALDFLFRQRILPGLTAGVPPPYVLSADQSGDCLEITLHLFGAAEACVGEAAEGLVRALRSGLALDRHRLVRLEPIDRRIASAADLARPPPAAASLAIRLVTPLVLRFGDRRACRPEAVMTSLFHRIVGLARWHGVEVSGGESWLSSSLRHVILDTARLVSARSQFRRTTNAGTGGIWIEPLMGEIRVAGDWRRLWPLLVLGEAVHVGGRTTLGYGRIRLVGA
jgi:hypothetical protein